MSSITNRFETYFDPTGETRRQVEAGAITAENAHQAAMDLAESIGDAFGGEVDGEPLPTQAECLAYIQELLAER